jgi:hypothetical protein
MIFSAMFKTAHIANFNYSTQGQSLVAFVLVLMMRLSFSIQNFLVKPTSARPFSLHSEIRQDFNDYFHLFLAFFCFDFALQFTSLTI